LRFFECPGSVRMTDHVIDPRLAAMLVFAEVGVPISDTASLPRLGAIQGVPGRAHLISVLPQVAATRW
jgi:hypothetical protein